MTGACCSQHPVVCPAVRYASYRRELVVFAASCPKVEAAGSTGAKRHAGNTSQSRSRRIEAAMMRPPCLDGTRSRPGLAPARRPVSSGRGCGGFAAGAHAQLCQDRGSSQAELRAARCDRSDDAQLANRARDRARLIEERPAARIAARSSRSTPRAAALTHRPPAKLSRRNPQRSTGRQASPVRAPAGVHDQRTAHTQHHQHASGSDAGVAPLEAAGPGCGRRDFRRQRALREAAVVVANLLHTGSGRTRSGLLLLAH